MIESPVLAILYVLAQAVERIVELVSEFKIWGDPDSTDNGIKHQRAIALWFVASMLGIVACWLFSVNFVLMLTQSSHHPILAIIISGIIVGSGSKPVHDVIATIEKYAVVKNNEALKSTSDLKH